MKKYINFTIENKNKPILRYYAFDVDDNLLFLETKINMEHLVNGNWIPEQVSTEKFAIIRNDKDNWRTAPNAYIEFNDYGDRGKNAFIEDVKSAIKNKKFGPSWSKFVECLTKGSIFAIITARGHEPNTIRKAIEWIIFNVLTFEQKNEMMANLIAFQDLFIQDFDILNKITFKSIVSNYLDNCDFVGISSKNFKEKYKINSDATTPEQSKILALNNFINKVKNYSNMINGETKIGFSDDDPSNIKSVKKYFGENSSLYKDIKLSIFDTSKK